MFGKCVQDYQRIPEMTYTIFIKFSLIGYIGKGIEDGYHLISPSNFTASLLYHLGLDERCFVTYNSLYIVVRSVTGDITLFSETKVLSSKDCAYHFLGAKLNELETFDVLSEMLISSQLMTFKLTYYNSPEKTSQSNSVFFFTTGDLDRTEQLYSYVPIHLEEGRQGFATFVIKPPYTCPYIILNQTEVCKLATSRISSVSCSDISSKQMKIFVHALVDGLNYPNTYRICVEDYFDVRTRTEHTYAELISTAALTTLSIISILISLWRSQSDSNVCFISKRSMCLSLLALIISHITNLLSLNFIANAPFCIAVRLLNHFFWLTTALCFTLFSVIVNRILKVDEPYSSRKTLCIFVLVFLSPLGLILVIFGANIIINNQPLYIQTSSPPDPVIEGIFFVFPIVLAAVCNIVVYVNIMRRIAISSAFEKTKLQHSGYDYLNTSLAFSTMTGCTWLIGFLATLFPSPALRYSFMGLCSGQSLLVFVLIYCSNRTCSFITTKSKAAVNENGEPQS